MTGLLSSLDTDVNANLVKVEYEAEALFIYSYLNIVDGAMNAGKEIRSVKWKFHRRDGDFLSVGKWSRRNL